MRDRERFGAYARRRPHSPIRVEGMKRRGERVGPSRRRVRETSRASVGSNIVRGLKTNQRLSHTLAASRVVARDACCALVRDERSLLQPPNPAVEGTDEILFFALDVSGRLLRLLVEPQRREALLE